MTTAFTSVFLFLLIGGLTGTHYGGRIRYFLTKRNQSEIKFTENNVASIKMNASAPTIFIIHGWNADANATNWLRMRDEFLKKYECNVVRIDWTEFSSKMYLILVSIIKKIGKAVAELFIELNGRHKIAFIDMHLVGYSLGAHLAGFIGKNIYKRTGEKLGRITALDPAGPLFKFKPPEERLTYTDAKAVVVFHTASKLLGLRRAVGTVDLYANTGYHQPGCSRSNTVGQEFCNHRKSRKYFIESINHPKYTATKCKLWRRFSKGLCDGHNKVIVQADMDPKLTGVYFFKTKLTS